MSCRFKSQSGFTLVEMMVVVAIFIITTGIVLSNFGGFREKSSLDLLAREMALIIRQAQVYGTATKLAAGASGGFPSYGIYAKGGTSHFILFADKDKDNKYDTGEEVERFNLYGGASILKIEGFFGNGDSEPIVKFCNKKNISWPNDFYIIFKRPQTEAGYEVSSNNGWDKDCDTEDYSYAQITIGKKSDQRNIHIWRTGHIYVADQQGNES
jgi:prepilin-type N-terminal cleavage/methylation domain-containing protein